MARAVYANADIIMMDDPISALDANVQKVVFKQLIKGMCKDKTRVLVTNSVDFLHLCDRIIVMKNGRIVSLGTYEDLKSSDHLASVLKIHN